MKSNDLLASANTPKEQQFTMFQSPGTQGGGVLPCMGYIGMYGPKGYGFSAVLVIQ